MKLLLTRTAEDNAALQPLLTQRGWEGVSLPLFTVEKLFPEITGTFNALIITSRNALHAIAPFKHLPCYVVGEKTAEALTAQGCVVAATAPDAARLLPLLPENPHYLYLSGEQVRENFRNTPLHVTRVVVYRTEPLPQRPFSTEGLDGVMFFSPTSVKILHAVYKDCVTLHMNAYCISPQVAQDVKTCFTFHQVHVAVEPTLNAMLQLVEQSV